MEPQRNPRPYGDVNWNGRIDVVGCTHMHCTSTRQLLNYVSQGLDFATLSNYYPSAPYYPLKDIRENTFRCRQNSYVKDGIWHHETIDFNELIDSWKHELPEDQRGQIPFAEGNPLFTHIPQHVLEAPNAEHHYFTDTDIWLHVTAPGATLTSSSFDLNNQFKLAEHGIQLGVQLSWKQAFRELLNSMMTPDGGGIVIAHPTWSRLPVPFITNLLDFDPGVLGIEVYNHGSSLDYADFSDSIWDAVLASGRQCFGFFVQDHPMPNEPWQGKIIILPQRRTAEDCLRALRKGNFYGVIKDTGLRFEHLACDGQAIHAACNREVQFQMISKNGVIGDLICGKDMHYTLPPEAKNRLGFVRLTATEPKTMEKLFAQPFIL